jgi:hypothetical protein
MAESWDDGGFGLTEFLEKITGLSYEWLVVYDYVLFIILGFVLAFFFNDIF